MTSHKGKLAVVGAMAGRPPEPTILAHLVEGAGGADARVTVLIAGPKGGRGGEREVTAYRTALEARGVANVRVLLLRHREQTDDGALAAVVADSTVVILAGGSPNRLGGLLAGSVVAHALARAWHDDGVLVVGVGAGASLLSEHMVADGATDVHPRLSLVRLEPGLGFFSRIVVDHHAVEGERLGRLLAIVARVPSLMGVGVDVKTALVVDPDLGLEVLGEGTVTVFDGRQLTFSAARGREGEDPILALANVQLNLLPAGFTFEVGQQKPPPGIFGDRIPPQLVELVKQVVATR